MLFHNDKGGDNHDMNFCDNHGDRRGVDGLLRNDKSGDNRDDRRGEDGVASQ
ncbi:MAG: hypothetical protein K9J37_00550 [Saprospiraceae bacterium]|nr:hypothetical protein [Saprospiraceae bacterium]MCF8248363.1 hypothetical protein [Saprospiraceae bacterium]MCF8283229.1 hypothetical protein [Bacteroidales bacterium]MCF8309891.1 hypothetical protein [Saprospiraceae bacterium]MCF8438778.1 hypothetical protein [Saprospiraceae bacterium]